MPSAHCVIRELALDTANRAMEVDTRSRCWVATYPWEDAEQPTEAVLPTDLNYVKAHVKYSKLNASVSIWFQFVNPQRASRIATSINQEFLVLKPTNATNYQAFKDIPFDWECVKDTPSNHGSTNRDALPNHSKEHGLESPCEPPTGSGTKPCQGTEGEAIDIDYDSDAYIADVKELLRIKRCIHELDDELGRVSKRMKHFHEVLTDYM